MGWSHQLQHMYISIHFEYDDSLSWTVIYILGECSNNVTGCSELNLGG